jgi:hypothetical protein
MGLAFEEIEDLLDHNTHIFLVETEKERNLD